MRSTRLDEVVKRVSNLPSKLKQLNLIGNEYTIIDVGCDHGYVAKRLHDMQIASRVIASDISKGSLNKARKNLADTNVELMLGDGLLVLEQRADTAIIAGIGGLEIVKILSEARQLPVSLVLVPHRDARYLREFLVDTYSITYDSTICDRGRYYSVIECIISPCSSVYSNEFLKTDLCLEFGVTNLVDPSEAFKTSIKLERALLESYLPQQMSAKRQQRLRRIIEVYLCLELEK